MAALHASDLIRIGGGVAVGGGENFVHAAKSVMEEHLKLVPAHQVELSHLGYATALRGAIAMALPGQEI